MSGKLPIDRVREARDAPTVYDEHRERFAEKQARLEQTDDVGEGERPPDQQTPLLEEQAEGEHRRSGDAAGRSSDDR